LKAETIPAIHLNSFPTQPHIILRTMLETLAAFEDGYPEIAMISRLKLSYPFAALIAILGIGLLLAPADAFARGGGGGGMAAGRAVGFRAPVMQPVMPIARPAAISSPALRGPVPMSVPAVRSRAATHIPGFRALSLHHRRLFGWALPLTIRGDGYGGYYNPAMYPYQYDQLLYIPSAATYPATEATETAPATTRVVPVVVRRAGCSSESMKVDSEDGGERSITIVRCWKRLVLAPAA
jgi:hypothetical protein